MFAVTTLKLYFIHVSGTVTYQLHRLPNSYYDNQIQTASVSSAPEGGSVTVDLCNLCRQDSKTFRQATSRTYH